MSSLWRGVIRAVAVTQCGTEAALDAAVQKNRVKTGLHNGIEMYFFPKVMFGKKSAIISQQTSSRSKDAAAGVFNEFKSFSDTFAFGLTNDTDSRLDSIMAISEHLCDNRYNVLLQISQ